MRRTARGPHRALVGLAVVAMAALFGCGQSGGDDAPNARRDPVNATPAGAATKKPTATPTPTPTPTAVDPCALVPEKDAEQLAGTPLDDPARIQETCTYTGPVTGPTAQVEVFVGPGAKKFLDIDRDLGHEFRPLEGIGDEAYAEDGVVFVHKSGTWVSIRLTLLDDPAKSRKPLEELARTVAGRI